MTLNTEVEVDFNPDFDYEETARHVVDAALDYEECPYEAEVNLLLTDNSQIKEINKEYRNIDKETDVLSFPMLEYETPGSFPDPDDIGDDCFNPDSGELILGDIIISVDKVKEQATEYGHSIRREFAFLIVHSMLHLMGYDHMNDDEAGIMEQHQEHILNKLQIYRD